MKVVIEFENTRRLHPTVGRRMAFAVDEMNHNAFPRLSLIVLTELLERPNLPNGSALSPDSLRFPYNGAARQEWASGHPLIRGWVLQ
jgi:hypothetical protein